MSDQRVTDDQAWTFAAYDGGEGTEWEDLDPSLKNATEADVAAGYIQRDEFLWLRDLALDLLESRALHADAVKRWIDCRERVRALELELEDVSPL
jgi:hypothetical protein